MITSPNFINFLHEEVERFTSKNFLLYLNRLDQDPQYHIKSHLNEQCSYFDYLKALVVEHNELCLEEFGSSLKDESTDKSNSLVMLLDMAMLGLIIKKYKMLMNEQLNKIKINLSRINRQFRDIQERNYTDLKNNLTEIERLELIRDLVDQMIGFQKKHDTYLMKMRYLSMEI
jgi:uncharacterized protein (DUF2225 family)